MHVCVHALCARSCADNYSAEYTAVVNDIDDSVTLTLRRLLFLPTVF
jgi:hypothetical protein